MKRNERTPLLSICIPCYGDYKRALMSMMALRLYFKETRQFTELVLCDNSPDHPDSEYSCHQVDKLYQSTMCRTTIVKLPSPTSACMAKGAAIESARGEIILCIDSGVLLNKGSIVELLKFFKNHDDTKDIYTGPLMHSDLIWATTHHDDRFRGVGWGTANQAWEAKDGTMFSVIEGEGKLCRFIAMGPGIVDLDVGGMPKDLPYAGHRMALHKLKFKMLGRSNEDIIPIQGAYSGLFTCLRRHWIPFAPGMEGHGGGDFALQQRYIRAGRKAWSLGFLKWWNPFDHIDPNNPPTPGRSVYNQVRNIALNVPDVVDRLKEYYVPRLLMPASFEKIAAEIQGRPTTKSLPVIQPESKQAPVAHPVHPHKAPPIQPGMVGDEVHRILTDLKIPACVGCLQLADAMNRIGIECCRQAKVGLANLIRKNVAKQRTDKTMSEPQYLANIFKVAVHGYTSYEAIIEEGCKRAEQKLRERDEMQAKAKEAK